MELATNQQPAPAKQPASRGLYARIWRWHFYAGMIFMPFLIVLAITGGTYLFKDQIDDAMYHKLYHIPAQETANISPSYQLEAVKKKYPDAALTSYKPSFGKDRTAEIGISGPEGDRTVFVNPYNGAIVGSLDPARTFTQWIRDFHGSLLAGDHSIGDKIIELSASWAIVLIVTGLYLWWPRGTSKIWGVLLPRFRKGRKTTIRDLHAVPMFWLSIVIIMLVITGLPWSGITGKYIDEAATSLNSNYPAGVWGGGGAESAIPTKDIMEVPWAAENLPVPRSSESGVPALPIENVLAIAKQEKIVDGYSVALPQDDKGVYTISVWPKNVYDEATIHMDQYSGKILTSFRFSDYGTMAQMIEIGIALHEGHYFGVANLILCLLACVAIAGSSILGAVMWWRRRPKGAGLGAPTKPVNQKLQRGAALIVIVLAILIPPVGITFLAALIVDWVIVQRISKLRAWLS
ncbi:PepSY domain-containing protein (plasmid) [Paenibacillus rhizovicinus]|uniref:PepSY domain-containing protein n=1 Tax=Paenibacillus rhizovicinus TaxID=2704463 RepID=A0A6C0P9Z9_9BACL|nr:PepSY domain-containing protein [Paenibacillus rhizovicinus]QHW35404.1 PepSY domain-containing protein [Paenibacillus rhizovicinus]